MPNTTFLFLNNSHKASCNSYNKMRFLITTILTFVLSDGVRIKTPVVRAFLSDTPLSVINTDFWNDLEIMIDTMIGADLETLTQLQDMQSEYKTMKNKIISES